MSFNRFQIEPAYRIDSELIQLSLAPALQMDQQLRRDYWSTIEHSDGRRWKNPPASNRSASP